jgi:hypothetical protein
MPHLRFFVESTKEYKREREVTEYPIQNSCANSGQKQKSFTVVIRVRISEPLGNIFGVSSPQDSKFVGKSLMSATKTKRGAGGLQLVNDSKADEDFSFDDDRHPDYASCELL